mgnify:CR=1 FL=1
MKIMEISHVSLCAKSSEELEKFYMDVLELPKVFDLSDSEGKIESSFFELPSGQFIEIIHSNASEDTDGNRKCDRSCFHVCLEVDARHQLYRDMAEKGMEITHTPDDSVGMCGSWCSFITDPEENEWELMEFSPISRQLADQLENMSYTG